MVALALDCLGVTATAESCSQATVGLWNFSFHLGSEVTSTPLRMISFKAKRTHNCLQLSSHLNLQGCDRAIT